MIPGIYELLDYTINTINAQNLPIIWSYQNAPRMNKAYVMIDYTDNDIPNFEVESSYIDLDGFRKMGSWRRATVSLQFYCGPNSDRIASQVAMMLAGNLSVDKQVELDIAIGNRLMLQRMPALLNNSQFEDRAIYQFDFYYTDVYKDNVGFIAEVIIDGEYTGAATGSVTCHEDIWIPYPEHHEDGEK
jgi:hypothetical protein